MNVQLDFSALDIPKMEIKLLDANHTTLNLMFPEVKLIERLVAVAPKMREAQAANDAAAIRQVNELVSDLMSNNLEGVTVKADELDSKYGLKFVHLIVFTAKYMEFINSVKDAKN